MQGTAQTYCTTLLVPTPGIWKVRHLRGYLSSVIAPTNWSVVQLSKTTGEDDPIRLHLLQTKLKHAIKHYIKSTRCAGASTDELYVRQAQDVLYGNQYVNHSKDIST